MLSTNTLPLIILPKSQDEGHMNIEHSFPSLNY